MYRTPCSSFKISRLWTECKVHGYYMIKNKIELMFLLAFVLVLLQLFKIYIYIYLFFQGVNCTGMCTRVTGSFIMHDVIHMCIDKKKKKDCINAY